MTPFAGREPDLDAFAEVVRAFLRDITETSTHLEAEGVQTVVWLVGLSSTSLALMAAQPGTFPREATSTACLAIALLATILLGVGQRVVQRGASRKRRSLMMDANLYVATLTMDQSDIGPFEESWIPTEIAAAAKKYFPNFTDIHLLSDSPVEASRRLYRTLRFEKRVATLVDLLAAIDGEGIVTDKSEEDRSGLETLVLEGRAAHRWDLAGGILFLLVGLAFSIAALVAAVIIL
jgi:hypothetical protein